MYSKLKIYISSLLVVVLGTAGCSEYLDGEKSKPDVIEFSDARFACLQSLPENLEKLSYGEAQESEIRESFSCMTEALRYFKAKTYGANPGSYTIEEIRLFFGKYFLKENNVSPQFASELMKVKRVLVGGGAKYITKDEIDLVIDMLAVLKEEIVLLAPHLNTLLTQATQKSSEWESISSAMEQLRRSSHRLLLHSQIAKSDYSFEDLKKLLTGFVEFIHGGSRVKPYERYGDLFALIESVKVVFMGQEANFLGPNQWRQGLDTVINFLELGLKYSYTLSDLKFQDSKKLRQLTQFITQSLQLIAESQQMKTKGYIPLQELDTLIDRVSPYVPNIRVQSLKKTYRIILVKMLDPERKADTRGLMGFERKHLDTLFREFNVWRLQQAFIDNLVYDQNSKISRADMVIAYDRFDVAYVIEKGLSEDPFEQKLLRQTWADFATSLQAPIPIRFDKIGRLIVSNQLPEMGATWASLTKANLMGTLSRALMIGYGQEDGLTKAGLSLWYDEFRDLFLDFGAFDPRSSNSGSRSFLEANLFTFSGNGDEILNHSELSEFVSTLFAAGLATSSRIISYMGQTACATPDRDLFKNFYLKQDCFAGLFREHFGNFFGNLPGMSDYIAKLTDAEFQELFSNLMLVAREGDQREGLIETANIRTMVTVIHYIESLFVTFDADRNQTLSLKEVYAATPRFMPFLAAMGGTSNQTLLNEGFAHLVFKGSVPGMLELGKFQLTKGRLAEARRMNIIRVFGALKDQLNKPAK